VAAAQPTINIDDARDLGQEQAAIGNRCLLATHNDTGSETMATEDQIRNYARQLWEKAGRPQGRDTEFWHAAEPN
jgi:hypothetical protein